MVYTLVMETKVFRSGNSLAVRLPKSMELPCGRVSIRREDGRIIIEAMSAHGWPSGFFESVRINRDEFEREVPVYHEKKL